MRRLKSSHLNQLGSRLSKITSLEGGYFSKHITNRFIGISLGSITNIHRRMIAKRTDSEVQ